MGSLQEALPRPVDADVEREFLAILRRKLAGAVGLYVNAIRAFQQAYGPDAREAIREYQRQKPVDGSAGRGSLAADNSLVAFCRALERACRGSHEWEKLEDTPARQAYRFTSCMWADIFRSLGAEDIGFWICEGDGPAAAAFNPAIRFKRTKTLMEGDDCCDHLYHVEKDA